jgi:hypothetical protein
MVQACTLGEVRKMHGDTYFSHWAQTSAELHQSDGVTILSWFAERASLEGLNVVP